MRQGTNDRKFSIDDLFQNQSHFVQRAKELWFKQETEGLREFLEEHYGFKVYKLWVFAWGYNNIQFLLKTDQGKLTARISQFRDRPREIIFEDLCSDFLYLHGLPVKRVIRTKDEKTFLRSSGGRTLQVMSYLDGKARKRFRESHIVSSGELLARIHQVGKHFPKEEVFPSEFTARQKPLEKILSRTRNQLAAYSQVSKEFAEEVNLSELVELSGPVLDQIETQIKKLRNETEETFIHGDYNPGNLTFDSEKVTGVFDFDMSGFGSIYWDVGFAIVHWTFKLNNWIPNRIEKAFLKGYEKIAGPQDLDFLRAIEKLAVLERLSATIYYFKDYQKKNYWILECSYFLRKFKMFLKMG